MYNPYSDWYYPTQGLQAQEQWYAAQQYTQPEQSTQPERYGDIGQYDGPPPAPGFSNRKTGHHPPELPISYREKQLMEKYEIVRALHAGNLIIPDELRTEILAANEAVVDTLRSGPGGFLGSLTPWATYHRCLLYSRGDAGARLRTSYVASGCSEWDDRLAAALTRRANALALASSHERAAGQVSPRGGTPSEGLAEGDRSLADQSNTAREESEGALTPGGPEGNWWDDVPEWVKKLLIYGGVGAVGLVTLRVLAPALFGTYLEHRRIDRSERRELEYSGDRAVW